MDAEPEVPVPDPFHQQAPVQEAQDIEVIPVPEPLEQPESRAGTIWVQHYPPTPTMEQMAVGPTDLTHALRTSVRQLDGLPEQPLRHRSRSPHREPRLRPVPEGRDALLSLKHQDEFYCFLGQEDLQEEASGWSWERSELWKE